MVRVIFADDEKKLRLLQVAVRLVDHTLAAFQTAPEPADAWKQITGRWDVLQGDKPIPEIVSDLSNEFLSRTGIPFYDSIRSAFVGPYDYQAQFQKLNKIGFEQARECITDWGGKKADKRFQSLKPLPLYCETTDAATTVLSFDRANHRIIVQPGEADKLIQDCRLIEFSFFHEYLSHAFPNWRKDQYALSEGWLLALEIYWFEETYTHIDTELLTQIWLERLTQPGREDYFLARRLLNRCESKTCVRRFLLEWVAAWRSLNSEDCEDLVTLFLGVANKAGSRLGGLMSPKRQATLSKLDEVLCSPCKNSSWKIKKMRHLLEKELDRYDTPRKV
jgi:hypothetical protein